MRIIAGTHKHRKICSPKSFEIRPTSSRLRETVFNICQHQIAEAEFLDVFAGSGAMGLEAISRGAKTATFIDQSYACIRCIQRNVSTLDMQRKARILQGNVFECLKKLSGQQFDLVYADPPYETMHKGILFGHHILEEVDRRVLLKDGGKLLIEEGRKVEPLIENLVSIRFVNHRQIGCSSLFLYEKIS